MRNLYVLYLKNSMEHVEFRNSMISFWNYLCSIFWIFFYKEGGPFGDTTVKLSFTIFWSFDIFFNGFIWTLKLRTLIFANFCQNPFNICLMTQQYGQKWAQNFLRSLTWQKVGKTHLHALLIRMSGVKF